MEVIEAALRRAALAIARGNAEEAHSAIDYAISQRPTDTLSDHDGIGFLGLDDATCDLLDSAGFETVGHLRRTGHDRLVRRLRDLPQNRLAGYARGRNLPSSNCSEVAHHLARQVSLAMQSFNVRLTRRGGKG